MVLVHELYHEETFASKKRSGISCSKLKVVSYRLVKIEITILQIHFAGINVSEKILHGKNSDFPLQMLLTFSKKNISVYDYKKVCI